MTSTPRHPDEIPTEDQHSASEVEVTNDDLETVEPVTTTAENPVTVTAPVSYPNNRGAHPSPDESKKVTRAGMVWTATVAGLVMLVLLIIFIVQNQDQVTLRYFGLSGQVSLGLALFIAAVGGGILAAIAGAVRIIQLRTMARKNRKNQY